MHPSSVRHELQLQQRPLMALGAGQRATFHWLLATLPADPLAHAKVEAWQAAAPQPFDHQLRIWEAEARQFWSLTCNGGQIDDASEQGRAVADGRLGDARLLQCLRDQPLQPRATAASNLSPEVTDMLPLYLQEQLQGVEPPVIEALDAVLELAAQRRPQLAEVA